MSRISYENFGKVAQNLEDCIGISGRYKIQYEAEKKILADVIKKLELQSKDSVLEIGCGAGNLLIPFSFFVRKITGIDHPACIKRLKDRFSQTKNVSLISGNFLDINLDKKYNKILCYSVIHYLENRNEVFKFIYKALQLLVPGGMALFGDIPNQSTKKRFVNSEQGRKFVSKWEELLKRQKDFNNETITQNPDKKNVQFDDDLLLKILKLFRDKGYHTYVFPQPPELPFGNTREDIRIKKIR